MTRRLIQFFCALALLIAQAAPAPAQMTFSGFGTASSTTLTGDVSGTGTGTVATTISGLTLGKLASVAGNTLLGNPTGSSAAPSAITLAGGLSFSGTTLTAAGALTPTSVAASGSVTGSNLSGTNTGDQTTVSGQAGSVANAVTFDNSGSGAASGTTFNGSATRTISTNTLGALKASNNLSDVASLNTAVRNLQGGYILGQSAIPFIIVSSGTMGNNGALSGIAGVSAVHANAYVYLPANAISTGSSAGLYYAVFSSLTAATVYNNTYTSGQPTIPGSPTAFSTTGPGAFTQGTTEVTLATITMPAAAMGANGSVVVEATFSHSSNADAKTPRIKFGGTLIAGNAVSSTTTSSRFGNRIANRGSAATQVFFTPALAGPYSFGTSVAVVASAVNTANSVDITITGQIGVATDMLTLESFNFTLYPQP